MSEITETLSSDASIILMSVASGDNMALKAVLNSGHKLKDAPTLVPYSEGRELQIEEELISSGLSAISVRHDELTQSISLPRACERLQIPPGSMKLRNSFRCLHRPDLKRVPHLRRMAPNELRSLFQGYADLPTTTAFSHFDKCESINKELKDDSRDKRSTSPSKRVKGMSPLKQTLEEIPASMRLRSTRARIYTSVLNRERIDFKDETAKNDLTEHNNNEAMEIDDDIMQHEELQVIMPPRYDEIQPGYSASTCSSFC